MVLASFSRNRPRLAALLLFALFMGLLVLSRAPFMSNVLVGEEGMHAAFVLAKGSHAPLNEQGIPQLMLGSFEGEAFLGATQHSIGPYVILRWLSGVWPVAVGDPLPISDALEARSIQARLPFLLLYLLGVAGLLWRWATVCVQSPSWRCWVFGGLLFYGLTTPLAIGGSIQPQIDASVGVALVGLAAWLLTAVWGPGLQVWKAIAAGALVGFGKQEWTLAFAAAWVVVLLLSKLWRCANAGPLGGFALGLGVGTALTYGLSPADYLASFNLMDHFLSKSSDVNRFELLMQWRSYLAPVLLFLLLMTVAGVGRLPQLVRQSPGAVIVAGGAWAIAVGFAAAGWRGDGFPRYYAPALVASLYALQLFVLGWPDLGQRRFTAMVGLAFIAFGLSLNFGVIGDGLSQKESITSIPGLRLKPVTRRFERIMERSGDENQAVYVDHSGLWIYLPAQDFVHEDPSVAATYQSVYPKSVERLVFKHQQP